MRITHSKGYKWKGSETKSLQGSASLIETSKEWSSRRTFLGWICSTFWKSQRHLLLSALWAIWIYTNSKAAFWTARRTSKTSARCWRKTERRPTTVLLLSSEHQSMHFLLRSFIAKSMAKRQSSFWSRLLWERGSVHLLIARSSKRRTGFLTQLGLVLSFPWIERKSTSWRQRQSVDWRQSLEDYKVPKLVADAIYTLSMDATVKREAEPTSVEVIVCPTTLSTIPQNRVHISLESNPSSSKSTKCFCLNDLLSSWTLPYFNLIIYSALVPYFYIPNSYSSAILQLF